MDVCLLVVQALKAPWTTIPRRSQFCKTIQSEQNTFGDKSFDRYENPRHTCGRFYAKSVRVIAFRWTLYGTENLNGPTVNALENLNSFLPMAGSKGCCYRRRRLLLRNSNTLFCIRVALLRTTTSRFLTMRWGMTAGKYPTTPWGVLIHLFPNRTELLLCTSTYLVIMCEIFYFGSS